MAHKAHASDIHLKEGKVPSLRIAGKIKKVEQAPLNEEDFDRILRTITKKEVLENIRLASNLDFSYEIPGLSRYRVNYCKDLGAPKLTLRAVPYDIPDLLTIGLPKYLEELVQFNNGIILVTGPTGSGKSTTLAAMINLINNYQRKHIITIEDPVEYIYTDNKSLITQRGLGTDTETFASGVKYALRQDPDVILVGEIRDKKTLESAIEAAETGHLVFSTLHTNSSIQTLNRIVGFFEDSQAELIMQRVINTLRATISQKLLPKIGGGVVPAVEIMSVTPAVQDYLAKNNFEDIYLLMQKSKTQELTTMNTSIYSHLQHGLISQEVALQYSDHRTELQQMIRGIYHGTQSITRDDII